MLVYELLYLVAVILLAKINSGIIKRGRKVWHFGNGLLHLTVAGFASAIWWWPMGFAVLCNTRVVFDICLNFFRGLPISYVSSRPASLIDRVELKLFGNEFYLVKLGYFVLSIGINAAYYVWIH